MYILRGSSEVLNSIPIGSNHCNQYALTMECPVISQEEALAKLIGVMIIGSDRRDKLRDVKWTSRNDECFHRFEDKYIGNRNGATRSTVITKVLDRGYTYHESSLNVSQD